MNEAIQQVQDAVCSAAAEGRQLRIVGAGSKAAWMDGAPGEALSIGALSGVRSYEPSELVMTVAGGTPLREVEAALAGCGQYLPFEPPHLGGAGTVGGAVASGLSGPARASVGALRDYILGVQIINGRGELLSFGGQVMKNVAGYDVSRLMAGSWGSLGVLTEVSLKVLPRPVAETTLMWRCTQYEALEWLILWSGRPLPLNASVWRADDEGSDDGQLFLRLRGARAAVGAAAIALQGEVVDDAPAQALWQQLQDQDDAWFAAASAAQDIWRLSVPQMTPPLDLPSVISNPLIEWHGGQRWVRAPAGDVRVARAVMQTATSAGGHAQLAYRGRGAEYADKTAGAGQARAQRLDGALARLQQSVRAAFDPQSVFASAGPVQSAGGAA